MKRVCGRVLAGLMIAAASGVVAPACAHNDTTIFIRDVLFPNPIAVGQTCGFTSDPTQAFLPAGTLDISFNQVYAATFLVGNQMVPEGNPSTPATETSFVTIQGAVVRITDTNGVQLNTFTTLAGASIPPSIGTTPSYAPITVTILDQPTVTTPSFYGPIHDSRVISRLITYTKFFGHTLGGQSVESNEFEFPVDVCRRCLINFGQADDDRTLAVQPNCKLGGMNTTATTVPCTPGIDTKIDCSQCLGNGDCNPPTMPVNVGIPDAGGGD